MARKHSNGYTITDTQGAVVSWTDDWEIAQGFEDMGYTALDGIHSEADVAARYAN